jgi:hypothetical protein
VLQAKEGISKNRIIESIDGCIRIVRKTKECRHCEAIFDCYVEKHGKEVEPSTQFIAQNVTVGIGQVRYLFDWPRHPGMALILVLARDYVFVGHSETKLSHLTWLYHGRF